MSLAIDVLMLHPTVGCDFKTNDSSNMRGHLATQHDVDRKQVGCDGSGCSFTTLDSSSLSAHKRRIHQMGTKNRLACHLTGCQSSPFFYADDLMRHFGSKHGIKLPFVCPSIDCSFSTYAQYYLNDHMNPSQ